MESSDDEDGHKDSVADLPDLTNPERSMGAISIKLIVTLVTCPQTVNKFDLN